jgi:hypothetical protein
MAGETKDRHTILTATAVPPGTEFKKRVRIISNYLTFNINIKCRIVLYIKNEGHNINEFDRHKHICQYLFILTYIFGHNTATKSKCGHRFWPVTCVG